MAEFKKLKNQKTYKKCLQKCKNPILIRKRSYWDEKNGISPL